MRNILQNADTLNKSQLKRPEKWTQDMVFVLVSLYQDYQFKIEKIFLVLI